MVNEALQNYRFHEAARRVCINFSGDFCDWYIEWVKPELQRLLTQEAGGGAWAEFVRGGWTQRLRFAASIYAVHHRRAVASVSATSGSAVYRARCVFPFRVRNGRTRRLWSSFAGSENYRRGLRNIRAEMKLEPKKKICAEFSSATKRTRKVIESSREGIMRW